MPTLRNAIPKYRKHRASGQAVVTISGRDHYLGPHGTKASKVEYDRLIMEWLAAGRPTTPASTPDALTVTELVAQYWKYAQGYYRKNGEPSGSIHRIKLTLRLLRESYGHTPAVEFGPIAIKALQNKLIVAGNARSYINDLIDCIRRVFRWGASEQLIPVTVPQALATVPGLAKGRTAAKEMPPVLPVDTETVETTLPCVAPIVADMVRFQRLTGCRPGEVCIIRPADVDRSADVWIYRPPSHKMEHKERSRTIFIGPQAQDILRPYLLRGDGDYCFSPTEAERDRKRRLREARKTKVQPTQFDRSTASPRTKPGDHYTNNSYRRAIHRACEKAFPAPEGSTDEEVKVWHKRHRWSPNQIRHAAATEIRKRFGLEAAQVALGHASADVTQVYAERDLQKAADIMREVG